MYSRGVHTCPSPPSLYYKSKSTTKRTSAQTFLYKINKTKYKMPYTKNKVHKTKYKVLYKSAKYTRCFIRKRYTRPNI